MRKSYDEYKLDNLIKWNPKRSPIAIKRAMDCTDDWFEKNGFYIEMTGGNCTAYAYAISATHTLLVTDTDGVDEPVFMDEDIFVVCYDEEGYDQGCIQMNLADFMEVW